MKPFRLVVVASALGGLWASPQAFASEALATKAGCTMCHSVTEKKMGPSYKEVAAKYKGQADAVALLSGHVRNGSKGVWGTAKMPATSAKKLSDDDLKAVITWILKTP